MHRQWFICKLRELTLGHICQQERGDIDDRQGYGIAVHQQTVAFWACEKFCEVDELLTRFSSEYLFVILTCKCLPHYCSYIKQRTNISTSTSTSTITSYETWSSMKHRALSIGRGSIQHLRSFGNFSMRCNIVWPSLGILLHSMGKIMHLFNAGLCLWT